MQMTFRGAPCSVTLSRYGNHRVAVQLFDAEQMPEARLSINIDGAHVGHGEFVLSHDVNRYLDEIKQSELFELTTKTVDYGMVEGQPIFRLAGEALAEWLAQNTRVL